jgi:hypothetical protein
MNENSCLNEAIFVFAVQSCFSKNLNFLTQTHGSKMVVKPTWVWHSCQAHDPWVWQLCKTLRYMGMANLSELANNKQRGQLCTLVVMRKKRKKKHKKSITNGNPIIICLHAPHHVKKDTVAHPVRQRMARFGH